MDRTERLLDLVALLLDATEPVSFARVRELFPDYAEGSLESNERKFERDKAELAELGIPLRYVAAEEDRPAGYLLDRDAYYLPELGLRASEWAVLYAAGSAALSAGAFPGARDLGHALRKIAFARGQEPVPQFTDQLLFAPEAQRDDPLLRERLDLLWDAVRLRKRVRFPYRGFSQQETEREVDPYGIALRRGVWIVVGHDHLRDAMRTFHVSRMGALTVNPKRPKSPDFEVPAGFSLQKHAQEQAWEHALHAPIEVELAIDPSLAPIALRLFPHARRLEGGERLRVKASFVDGLVRQVLALGTRVEILAPPSVRARAVELLEELNRALGEEGP